MSIFNLNNSIVFVDSSRGAITSSEGANFINEQKVVGVLELTTATNGIQFRIPSGSSSKNNKDLIPFFFSGSNDEVKLGIGTKAPLGTLDIRTSTSSKPPNIILRSNNDEVVEIGEETGRIRFIIESSSFSIEGVDGTSSGSTAEIFSRVTDTDISGVKGSLVFALNKTNTTSSIDAFTLGYEIGSSQLSDGDVHAVLSGSMEMNAEIPRLILYKEGGTQPLALIGSVDNNDFNHAAIILKDAAENDNGYFVIRKDQNSFLSSSGNLGIGTTSPDQKLHVFGNAHIQTNLSASSLNLKSGYINEIFGIKTDNNLDIDLFEGGTAYNANITAKNINHIGEDGNPHIIMSGSGDITADGFISASNFIAKNEITASGNVNLEGTLSIPGFSDVSASLAAISSSGGVTTVTTGDGLDVDNGSTTPNITIEASEFIDLSAAIQPTVDEFVIRHALESNLSRKRASEINVNVFNMPGSVKEIPYKDSSDDLTTDANFLFDDNFGSAHKIFIVGDNAALGSQKIGFRYGNTVSNGNAIFNPGNVDLYFENKIGGNSYARFERNQHFFSLYPTSTNTNSVSGLARLHVSDNAISVNNTSNPQQPVAKFICTNPKGLTGLLVQTSVNALPAANTRFKVLEFHRGASNTQVNGTTVGGVYWDPYNTFGIVNNTYQMVFTGGLATGSDRKLKTNITDTRRGLNDILKLKVKDFNLKTDLEKAPQSTGFIAQEVQETYPELVGIDTDKDFLVLNQLALIPVLTKAIQELQQQVDELKNQLNNK